MESGGPVVHKITYRPTFVASKLTETTVAISVYKPDGSGSHRTISFDPAHAQDAILDRFANWLEEES